MDFKKMPTGKRIRPSWKGHPYKTEMERAQLRVLVDNAYKSYSPARKEKKLLDIIAQLKKADAKKQKPNPRGVKRPGKEIKQQSGARQIAYKKEDGGKMVLADPRGVVLADAPNPPSFTVERRPDPPQTVPPSKQQQMVAAGKGAARKMADDAVKNIALRAGKWTGDAVRNLFREPEGPLPKEVAQKIIADQGVKPNPAPPLALPAPVNNERRLALPELPAPPVAAAEARAPQRYNIKNVMNLFRPTSKAALPRTRQEHSTKNEMSETRMAQILQRFNALTEQEKRETMRGVNGDGDPEDIKRALAKNVNRIHRSKVKTEQSRKTQEEKGVVARANQPPPTAPMDTSAQPPKRRREKEAGAQPTPPAALPGPAPVAPMDTSAQPPKRKREPGAQPVHPVLSDLDFKHAETNNTNFDVGLKPEPTTVTRYNPRRQEVASSTPFHMTEGGAGDVQTILPKDGKIGVAPGTKDHLGKLFKGIKGFGNRVNKLFYGGPSKHDTPKIAEDDAVVGDVEEKPGPPQPTMQNQDDKPDQDDQHRPKHDESHEVGQEGVQRNPEFPTGDMTAARRDGMDGRPPDPFKDVEVYRRGDVMENRDVYQGDDVITSHPTHDDSRSTLRPSFGVAGPGQLIPSTDDQLRSDLEFDLFGVVPPGYGNGADNKLFLYEEGREKNIVHSGPFFEPNQWLGPLCNGHPMPWQWQNVKAPSDIEKYNSGVEKLAYSAVGLVNDTRGSSLGVLGRDLPEVPCRRSTKGLMRDVRSPFEPVIHNKQKWTPDIDPAGIHLGRRGFKRQYSAWRDPDAREMARDAGGPHLKIRRSLEVVLP